MTGHAAPATPRRWTTIVVIGLVGGLLSGLFAIGGGIVMVPLLVTFAKVNQRVAAATSLAAIVPTSIVGSITYLVAGEVDLLAAVLVSVGAVVGALAGSALLKRIPLTWLRWMFIVFILLVAARLFFITPQRGHDVAFTPAVGVGYVVLGLLMGVLSALFGIGGGIIAVPALINVFGVSDLIAKGTSLVVMIPTSVVGTISNWRAKNVDVPTGLALGLAATVASVPGAWLALALPPQLSSTLFGLLLIAVAAQLTWKAIAAQRLARRKTASEPSP
ncbi:sulfite exporter TauE/SafE family protein [Leifsonia virtsii]|uniref:Probable membrane transporter protein n=1 Tax=Leifsonia virtsii TaxID=3035915 RepID=A0ABT8J1J1_9MICO|nr:sulfite exporter TauE/SafE family protein [Leifsonia virtsii]MDN4598953.1 sulfite exporter TauE/SafE family protein [Leifsonia virtsii]